VQRCQDFVDLAAMMERGEVVSVPAVTDTYILFGVGARVDGGVFTRYVAHQNIELNDEAGLRDAYARLESAHAKLQKDISGCRLSWPRLKRRSYETRRAAKRNHRATAGVKIER